MNRCPFMNNHPGDQNNMANVKEQNAVLGTNGIVLHRALGYDIFVWLISLGRERG
jgi:hypothetical protein